MWVVPAVSLLTLVEQEETAFDVLGMNLALGVASGNPQAGLQEQTLQK